MSSVPPQMTDIEFPVKVYTFNPDKRVPDGCDYYDMTESELFNKCCIYSGRLYFRKSIPEYIMDAGGFDHYNAELYDIWNYECVEWWEWPQELKEVMYKKVPRSNPEPQPA